MAFFATQHSLFRAYDIRGARQLFNTDFIQALGRAFADLYQAQTNSRKNHHRSTHQDIIVVIGYDVRFGSDIIAQRLADILTQHGLHVIWLGLVTTPMMVFWAEQHQGHGIVLTASHSAKDVLGIKWLVSHQSPSSTDIQTLYQQIIYQQFTERPLDDRILTKHGLQTSKLKAHNLQKHELPNSNLPKTTPHHDHKPANTQLNMTGAVSSTSQQTYLSPQQVATPYIETIAQVFEQLYQPNNTKPQHTSSATTKLNFRIVIDCMHGATSPFAQRLFARFCRQVIMLNDTPNSDFPLGNPDPTEPNRLTQLQQAVIGHSADIGIAFDGDGDRVMIVDHHGQIVTPDHLLYLLANIALSERPAPLKHSQPSPQVLFDIKCAHHLSKLLRELGARPVISKTGSSMMRQQMQQSAEPIVFAGELSGHFIFNDSRFIIYDDAMYAALRLLHWLDTYTANAQNATSSLAELIASLPTIVSTADHYLPLPKMAKTECSIVEQLTQLCLSLQHLNAAATLNAQGFEPKKPNQQNKYSNQKISGQINDPATHAAPTNALSAQCTCTTEQQAITPKDAKKLLPAGTTLSCIDGIRLDFAHGFGVLRQSNTSQNLTVRFAGDSLQDLKDVQATFVTLCHTFDRKLAAQIAAINPE